MLVGCIADDFTGGSDIASFFVKGGLSTVLYNGIPDVNEETKADVCVIALKTRTQEREAAVKDSLAAISWLREKNAQQFYVKYCSTFDSTPEGNIGPICDAVMETLHVPYTVLCPALPVNGRTVKNGNLYVNGIPLHKGPMRDHPLTPMWDSDIVELMKVQSAFPSIKLHDSINNKVELEKHIKNVKDGKSASHFYIIPEHRSQEDALKIVKLFGNLKLITGGSGLAEPLAKKYHNSVENKAFGKSISPALILAGSCSEATRNQILEYQRDGGKSYFMDPKKLLSGEDSIENIWNIIKENKGESILVYSSDTPKNVKNVQGHGVERVAGKLEYVTAELAERAVNAGYHRVIVAGGETSGAITKRLGFSHYHVGESIAPGVPILIPIQDTRIRLVLKSGNFGEPKFFLQALSLT